VSTKPGAGQSSVRKCNFESSVQVRQARRISKAKVTPLLCKELSLRCGQLGKTYLRPGKLQDRMSHLQKRGFLKVLLFLASSAGRGNNKQFFAIMERATPNNNCLSIFKVLQDSMIPDLWTPQCRILGEEKERTELLV
jgi:hypothetical protein